ncbi:hypothetical protein ANN_14481 [Periplaneta americana]|uniref:Uncharacterized protein n=1 Tax=Periplaneta americana TaxID=6978 RepID=A0ABQ8SWG0_PERAM|nr:hypothetical protein ANN_14481 [Periplaneta americana]
MSLKEQRGNIKYCVKLCKTLALMRQSYGEEAMSRTRLFERHKRFTSTDGDPRSGKLRSARTEEMIP